MQNRAPKDADAAYLEAEYGDVTAGDWPPRPRRPARRSWLAALLSVLLPGLGHAYVGEVGRGLALWGGLIALLMLTACTGVLDRFWGLAVVLGAVLALYLYAAGDAASRARRLTRFEPRPYHRWWVYVAVLLVANLVVGPAFRRLLPIQSFVSPSGGMDPTLRPGDHFYARKGSFGPGDLERGDVVVFRSPEEPSLSVVHRIVALPGEEIDLVDKAVRIDGEPLEEPYARYVDATTYPDAPGVSDLYRARDQFGPFRVPEGHIFLLGDNRDRSYDSRFIGPVSIESIYARPLYVYWNSRDGWQHPDLSRIGESIE